MALGFAAGMTVESLVTPSRPDQMAVLFAAMIASYSVAAPTPTLDRGRAGHRAARHRRLGGRSLSTPATTCPTSRPPLPSSCCCPVPPGSSWARRSRDVDDSGRARERGRGTLWAARSGRACSGGPVRGHAAHLERQPTDVVLLVASAALSNKGDRRRAPPCRRTPSRATSATSLLRTTPAGPHPARHPRLRHRAGHSARTTGRASYSSFDYRHVT